MIYLSSISQVPLQIIMRIVLFKEQMDGRMTSIAIEGNSTLKSFLLQMESNVSEEDQIQC